MREAYPKLPLDFGCKEEYIKTNTVPRLTLPNVFLCLVHSKVKIWIFGIKKESIHQHLSSRYWCGITGDEDLCYSCLLAHQRVKLTRKKKLQNFSSLVCWIQIRIRVGKMNHKNRKKFGYLMLLVLGFLFRGLKASSVAWPSFKKA